MCTRRRVPLENFGESECYPVYRHNKPGASSSKIPSKGCTAYTTHHHCSPHLEFHHHNMPGIDVSKCVLITGATAGIGRALAYKIRALPSKPQVIVAGRRQERLDELAKEGFETYKMDVGVARPILKKDAETLLAKYPDVGFI